MMTSSRPRDAGGSFSSRKRHANQLSISDPSHHVTEAIGTMYGDDEDYSPIETSRPLSFISAPNGGEQLGKQHQLQLQQQRQPQQQPPRQPQGPHATEERQRLVRSQSDGPPTTSSSTTNGNGLGGLGTPKDSVKKAQTMPTRAPSQRSGSGSLDGPKSPVTPMSPTLSLRDVQADAAGSQFPMGNMDNPNDIAQELSNLQALRRMSMDVSNNTDPDLLPFSGVSLMAMPAIAPTGDDDAADPSRLLWVPARVHPELEPSAFKNFLEDRVQTIKRRSGDSLLSIDGLERHNSIGGGGSLRRKKSMLSRQINHREADGYMDGAERLERKQSLKEPPIPEMSLEDLVKDPTKVVERLAQEARQEAGSEDLILPVAPGMGLRRSTRTQYRKGGSLRGNHVPFSKRVAGRNSSEKDGEDRPPMPTLESSEPGLQRVHSEPALASIAENYSRPTRSVRRQQKFSQDLASSPVEEPSQDSLPNLSSADTPDSLPQQPQQFPPRTEASLTQRASAAALPQIVETPPMEESAPVPSTNAFPARSSSQNPARPASRDQPSQESLPMRLNKRPAAAKQPAQQSSNRGTQHEQTAPANGSGLTDIMNHPSPVPGGGVSRNDNLTFVPTFSSPDDKKAEKKAKDRDDSDSIMSSKSSSSWKWFKSEKEKKKKEKEEEREREREREEREEQAKKAKGKDKGQDNARLDVLQSSIDNGSSRSRESVVLDRDSIDSKLHEERKKEGNRKSSEGKKEKEGFFGGLFGGSKKKAEKEPHSKRKDLRPTTPDPPPRILQPDVDYPWTRFPIIEERAIYRMAHLKLANPRRSLHSQVLLSNFMYSYLAKVQAMHPHIQVPISPQQKKLEEERKRREAEQAQLQMEQQRAAQQSAAGQDGNYNFEYHRSGTQYGEASKQYSGSGTQDDGSVQYMDEAARYQYEHGDDGHGGGSSHANGGGYYGQHDYYQGHERGQYDDDDDGDDMW